MSGGKKMTALQKTLLGVWAAVSAVILAVVIWLNCYAASFDGILRQQFGAIGESTTAGSEMSYVSDYETNEDAVSAMKEHNKTITEEGAVILKNDNDALPLAKGSSVSVFGMASVLWTTLDRVPVSKNAVLADAMEDYGFNVNSELRKFYKTSTHTNWGQGESKGDGSGAGSWTVDEVPQSEYTDDLKSTYSSYDDEAIIVLSRSCGEGGDLPRSMDRFGGTDDEHYLELTAEEKDLFKAVGDANFKKVVVILHMDNAFEMSFLNDYDFVDAVIWIGGTGDDGVEALPALLAGETNPSGRLTDTYVYDNFSAPATQNFGDYRYVDASGNLTDYSYVNYSEGIYVGYRYYETRYEDYVLGQGSAGNYIYPKVVMAPFGYGESYTTFEWSDYSCEYNEDTDSYDVSVTVTNTGAYDGKDVVEVYIQQPYTAYDKENGVEKASVELAGYAKTSLLAKNGGSETVSVSVSRSALASYDTSYADGTGAYLLEGSDDYYITAATDAHAAVNNILAAKSLSEEQKARMDAEGDASLVKNVTVAADDAETYSGTENGTVSNLFGDCTLDDATYLSRSDWSVMENSGLTYATDSMDGVSNTTNKAGTVKTAVVTDANYAVLSATGWDSSGNPNSIDSYPAITTEADNDMVLADVIGLDYDDPLWSTLLDKLDITTMHNLYKAGAYTTIEISSINKPITNEHDGPEGLSLTNGPAQVTIGATWNDEIAEQYGRINGSIGILTNNDGWYAPGANIHRTPFSGRNYEYVSEDSYLTGSICSDIAIGAKEKGLNVIMKHFALNEQETNRTANGSVATYCGEQAIRQLYTEPYRMAIRGEAKIVGVMLSLNRLGNHYNCANYNLETGLLINEWGFPGMIITDYNVLDSTEDSLACLAAGTSLQLYGGNPVPSYALSTTGCAYMLREAAHHNLYFCANSLALNGYTHETVYNAGVSVYVLLLALIDAIIVAILVCGFLLHFFKYRAKASCWDDGKAKKYRKLTIIYWAIVAAIIIVALIIFLVYGLPLLQQAFTIS